MIWLWFLVGLLALIALLWAIDLFQHRHPLEKDELMRLAQKRRRNKALQEYNFSTVQIKADPADKKAMDSEGEFVSCDLDYHNAPARIAGLLKYKKHEWIVIAFITRRRVHQMWWNKGPDGTRVWSFLRDHSLRATIVALKPYTIVILHNHPNPNPSRYRMNIPSEADLRSAGFYSGEFDKLGDSLLEFICERGTPHIYYAAFVDAVIPIQPIVAEIEEVNGTGLFANYWLRKELGRTTRADQIAGPNSLSPYVES